MSFLLIVVPGPSVLFVIGRALAQGRRAALTTVVGNTAAQSGLRTFWEGFAVGVTNPKTIVFFAAVLPQFIDRGQGHVAVQMLVLGLVFNIIAIVCDMVWGLIASTARGWFARSPRRLSMVGGVGGLTMIGLGLTVSATGRKD